jgi:hypothetical protein
VATWRWMAFLLAAIAAASALRIRSTREISCLKKTKAPENFLRGLR